jgi:hypothetical protein
MTPRIPLKVVIAPAVGVVLKAPPVLIASEHSVDYTCGRCGTVLLHADEDQVHGILRFRSRPRQITRPPTEAAYASVELYEPHLVQWISDRHCSEWVVACIPSD